MSRAHLEDDEAKALWQWAQTQPIVRNALYAIPNGGKRLAREAARLKAMGVRAGVSDYHLPVPRGSFHGLWIELKAGKGRPTESQSTWVALMQHHGHRAAVCTGWEAAKDEITRYMRLGLPVGGCEWLICKTTILL